MPAKKNTLVDPADLAALLNAGAKIEDLEVPTFTHTFNSKGSDLPYTFENVPVVLQCSQTKVWSPVAKIENGEFVADNTFIGNDKTSKATGFYRIDKAADKVNQTKWREEQKAKIEAAQALVEAAKAEAPVEEEAPKPATRRRQKKVA